MGLSGISGVATVDDAVPPYGGAHVLTTTVPITRFDAGAHGSTVKDDDVPLAPGPAPLFAPVWQYTCFDDLPNPEPAPEPCGDRCPDLGDAPDSNNTLGNVMSIHPFGAIPQPAFYPTEFTSAAGTGPIHLNAGSNSNPLGVPFTAIDSALGLNVVQGNLISRVSNERNAFLLPDQDVRKRNIIPAPIPANGRSNRDGFDNAFVGPAGARLPVKLAPCQPTSIAYSQFIHAPWAMNGFYAGMRYINVWVDLNRDGDWADSFAAPCPDQPNASTSEWLVQNSIAPASSGVFTLPAVLMTNVTDNRPTWLRISISDSPAPAGSIGNGPATGYRFGETEDHFMCYREQAGVWVDCPMIKLKMEDEVGDEVRVDLNKPVTFTVAIEDDAVYPVTLTWTITGEGVTHLGPNFDALSTQAADARIIVKQVIPAPGIATQPVILGWYGCITCTMMSAATVSAIAAFPPPALINVELADSSGYTATEDLTVNVGWRVFVPAVLKEE